MLSGFELYSRWVPLLIYLFLNGLVKKQMPSCYKGRKSFAYLKKQRMYINFAIENGEIQ